MSDYPSVDSNGGELTPYTPSQPLAPVPDQGWMQEHPDYLTDRQAPSQAPGQLQPGTKTFFGAPLTPTVTPAQIDKAIAEISAVFTSDFAKLGHSPKVVNAALAFLIANADQPEKQVTRLHSYNLHNFAGDWLAEAFANQMAHVHASQKFISDTLWWMGELARRVEQQNGAKDAAQGSAPSNPLDQLTDKQYAQVVKINEEAKAQTHIYLRDIWGTSYANNLRMVDAYLKSLPAREHQALDQFTAGWVNALNTKEVILGLYKQAIGSHSMPSGGAVQTEITQIEDLMRTNRKAYNSDERIQARYRELIKLRDG
ncbi:MAG: hypothetical protein ACI9UK_000674 [Candidatus Krumholzibacteriia bacterium]|jgi:hypothetical protein